MNDIEQKMFDILQDLKKNNGIVALKAEFEEEGACFDEIKRLRELACDVGLGLTVKIGGASALSDMYQAKLLGADIIAAPMAESPYAVKKFLMLAERVFDSDTKLFVNIETKYALDFIKEILEQTFTGIVLGRTDLACSLGYTGKEVNNDRILCIAKELSSLAEKTGKEFIVGGGVSVLSIPFFKSLPYFSGFETRKVVFKADYAMNSNIEEGILKALDFELLWLENNKENYNEESFEDKQRIEILKSRTV